MNSVRHSRPPAGSKFEVQPDREEVQPEMSCALLWKAVNVMTLLEEHIPTTLYSFLTALLTPATWCCDVSSCKKIAEYKSLADCHFLKFVTVNRNWFFWVTVLTGSRCPWILLRLQRSNGDRSFRKASHHTDHIPGFACMHRQNDVVRCLYICWARQIEWSRKRSQVVTLEVRLISAIDCRRVTTRKAADVLSRASWISDYERCSATGSSFEPVVEFSASIDGDTPGRVTAMSLQFTIGLSCAHWPLCNDIHFFVRDWTCRGDSLKGD